MVFFSFIFFVLGLLLKTAGFLLGLFVQKCVYNVQVIFYMVLRRNKNMRDFIT